MTNPLDAGPSKRALVIIAEGSSGSPNAMQELREVPRESVKEQRRAFSNCVRANEIIV